MERRQKMGQQQDNSMQAKGKRVERNKENTIFCDSVISFSLLSLLSMSLQGKQLASVACGADGLRGAHTPRRVWHTSEVAGDCVFAGSW